VRRAIWITRCGKERQMGGWVNIFRAAWKVLSRFEAAILLMRAVILLTISRHHASAWGREMGKGRGMKGVNSPGSIRLPIFHILQVREAIRASRSS
jgi:hypothetical protein